MLWCDRSSLHPSWRKSQGLVESLIEIAKTDVPPPNDEEVKAMLDERLV
jgi:hypothetical protein